MNCEYCGEEIHEDYEFCMACGEKIKKTSDNIITPKKTCLLQKKNLIIISVIVVMIIITSAVTVYFINYNIQRNGLYKNINWGTELSVLKEIAEDDSDIGEFVTETPEQVSYKLKRIFENNIESGYINFHLDEKRRLKGVDLYWVGVKNEKALEFCIEKLTKLYGKPYMGYSEENEGYKVWETKKGCVVIVNFCDAICIHYKNDLPDFSE